MSSWIVLALMTAILWGIWGLCLKIASSTLQDWRAMYVLSNLAIALLIPIILVIAKPHIRLNTPTILALLAGIFAVMAEISLYKALERGPAILVTPLTSLYPAITAILACLILKEHPTTLQIIGILFALIAILLISISESM